MSKKVPANQNDKRGYRTASEYAAQAAARIQINENGFIDIVSFCYRNKSVSDYLSRLNQGSTDRSQSVRDFQKFVGPSPVRILITKFCRGSGPTGFGPWSPGLS